MSEFEKYLKRNDLDKYLGAEERRLVFDYVDESHGGTLAVRDFLKKVEEREFYGHEHNKDHTKLKDFLEFHIKQKRAQQATASDGSVAGSRASEQSPERKRLEELKRSKGLENEVEKMKKALGMRTFGLDVDPEELDNVVEEVFHKPPTNESHRKYARFLHHSQLNLAAIPFYDFRAREIDRLKSRSALIDEELTREGLKEEYDTLKSTMLRGSLAVSQSLPSLPTLTSSGPISGHGQTTNQHNSSSSIPAVRPSPLASTSTRPLTANQVAQINSYEMAPDPSLSLHAHPPPSPSSHGTYQVAKAQPARLEALTTSNELAAPQPSASPGKPASKFNKRDWAKEHTTKQKSMVLTDNIDHHISKGKEFDDMSATTGLGSTAGGGTATVASGSYLGLLIEQAPPSDDGEAEFLNMLATGSSPTKLVKHTTAASQKKALSKLVNRSQATQDHMSDFYTQVIDPSQSMGRSKDPTKIMRIEKTDFTASLGQPVSHLGGKKTFADKLASQDASRVGLGVNVRYYDSASDLNSGGGGSHADDQGSLAYSSYSGPLSPLRESSVISSFTTNQHSNSQGWDADDMYRSVASMQYPPLIYEPSQPVRRDVPSLAMQEAAKREHRRQERYARKQANMDVTKNRLAYETLNAQLREMHRTQSRIEDAIRYKSSIFLGDLQSFRQQPLQRMSKRQNMDLSEKMWGGNLPKQTVGLVQDSREFTSTYRSDFDSDKLRHSDTLKGPMAQQLAAMEKQGSSGVGPADSHSYVSHDTHSGVQ